MCRPSGNEHRRTATSISIKAGQTLAKASNVSSTDLFCWQAAEFVVCYFQLFYLEKRKLKLTVFTLSGSRRHRYILDVTLYKVCDIFNSSNSGVLALSFPCMSAILDKCDIIGIQAYSSKEAARSRRGKQQEQQREPW